MDKCRGEVPGVYLQDTLWTSLFARNMLPACYGPAGRHPPPPEQADMKSKRKLSMTSLPSVSGRDRVLASRTVGCREQPSSAQGWLERVLEASTRAIPWHSLHREQGSLLHYRAIALYGLLFYSDSQQQVTGHMVVYPIARIHVDHAVGHDGSGAAE
jgi:hypothetical protein